MNSREWRTILLVFAATVAVLYGLALTLTTKGAG